MWEHTGKNAYGWNIMRGIILGAGILKAPEKLAIAELTVKVKTTWVILNYQKKRIIIITTQQYESASREGMSCKNFED